MIWRVYSGKCNGLPQCTMDHPRRPLTCSHASRAPTLNLRTGVTQAHSDSNYRRACDEELVRSRPGRCVHLRRAGMMAAFRSLLCMRGWEKKKKTSDAEIPVLLTAILSVPVSIVAPLTGAPLRSQLQQTYSPARLTCTEAGRMR